MASAAVRLSQFTVSFLFVLGGVAGCSSDAAAAEDAASAPPPSEPMLFESSDATKSELGIVEWGFVVDPVRDETTFRGYGPKNEVLATIVQRNESPSPDRLTFTMTFTGKDASAREKIDFYLEASAEGRKNLMMNVVENTFRQGELSGRVLRRFEQDGAGAPGTILGGSSGALVQKSVGDELVTRCNESVQRCLGPLIDARGDASAAGDACGFLSLVGEPLIVCGVAAGVTAITGPGAGLACLGAGGASVIVNDVKCWNAQSKAKQSRQSFSSCDSQACAPAK